MNDYKLEKGKMYYCRYGHYFSETKNVELAFKGSTDTYKYIKSIAIEQNETLPQILFFKFDLINICNDRKDNRYDDEIYTDINTYYEYLSELLNSSFPKTSKILSQKKLSEIAEYVIFNLPSPRKDWYFKSDVKTVTKDIVSYFNEILYLIGYNEDDFYSYTIIEDFKLYEYVNMILELVLVGCIIILLSISAKPGILSCPVCAESKSKSSSEISPRYSTLSFDTAITVYFALPILRI